MFYSDVIGVCMSILTMHIFKVYPVHTSLVGCTVIVCCSIFSIFWDYFYLREVLQQLALSRPMVAL